MRLYSLSNLGCWLLFSGTAAAALPATFTLDPARSLVTLSGTVQGSTINQQGPGSLTAAYSGTFQTAMAGNSIQFLAGSSVDAQVSGNWAPKAGGVAGTDPADYGGQASNGLATVTAALRHILFDVTSTTLALSGTGFDAAAINFAFPADGSSSLDYRATGLIESNGTRALSGLATNAVGSAGSLVVAANVQTLTIPIDVTYQFTIFSTNDVTLHLDGSLVAARAFGETERSRTYISVSGNTVTLEWESVPGESNSVDASVNLAFWTPRPGSVVSTGPVTTWSTPKGGPFEFFRRRRTTP